MAGATTMALIALHLACCAGQVIMLSLFVGIRNWLTVLWCAIFLALSAALAWGNYWRLQDIAERLG